MKCQNLFSGKNTKNISKCHLLKIYPECLSINNYSVFDYNYASTAASQPLTCFDTGGIQKQYL